MPKSAVWCRSLRPTMREPPSTNRPSVLLTLCFLSAVVDLALLRLGPRATCGSAKTVKNGKETVKFCSVWFCFPVPFGAVQPMGTRTSANITRDNSTRSAPATRHSSRSASIKLDLCLAMSSYLHLCRPKPTFPLGSVVNPVNKRSTFLKPAPQSSAANYTYPSQQ